MDYEVENSIQFKITQYTNSFALNTTGPEQEESIITERNTNKEIKSMNNKNFSSLFNIANAPKDVVNIHIQMGNQIPLTPRNLLNLAKRAQTRRHHNQLAHPNQTRNKIIKQPKYPIRDHRALF